MTASRSDWCVTDASLRDGQALSYTQQPYFRDLIEQIQAAEKDLLILVGSGPSVDAGYPSSRQVASKLVQGVVPEDLSGVFDEIHHGDATQFIHRLTPATQENGLASDLLRAVYGERRRATEAPLSRALARLILAYPGRCRVATTTLSNVLEQALDKVCGSPGKTKSLALRDADEWFTTDPEPQEPPPVLHLHGMVSPIGEILEPLLLNPTDRLIQGGGIAVVLKRAVTESITLALGASSANASLTAGFAADRPAHPHRFVVSVPPLVTPSGQDAATYAVWEANRQRQRLEVKPILLKSYSQLTQLVSECALACVDTEAYLPTPPMTKNVPDLHYGRRFDKGLEAVYKALGYRNRQIADQAAVKLSRTLNDRMFEKSGPVALLEGFRTQYRGKCASEENFGLFLWLREPVKESSKYSIRLISTSVYAHWKGWSSFRSEAIGPQNKNAAAQAIYYGHVVFQKIDRSRHSGSWQGAVALPWTLLDFETDVRIKEEPLDQLMVGAIALNTDRVVEDPNALGEVERESLSVLSLLTESQLVDLRNSLAAVVLKGYFPSNSS